MTVQATNYDLARRDRFWREDESTRNKFMRYLLEECRLDYSSVALHFGVPMQTIWRHVQKYGWRYNPDPRYYQVLG